MRGSCATGKGGGRAISENQLNNECVCNQSLKCLGYDWAHSQCTPVCSVSEYEEWWCNTCIRMSEWCPTIPARRLTSSGRPSGRRRSGHCDDDANDDDDEDDDDDDDESAGGWCDDATGPRAPPPPRSRRRASTREGERGRRRKREDDDDA